MKSRLWMLLALLVVITLAACAAPTPETVVETVVVEKEVEKIVTQEVEKEVVVEVPAAAEPELVTFMSWAEDAFEVEALDQLIESFKAEHPDVTVECEVVTFVNTGMVNCDVILLEGGEQ